MRTIVLKLCTLGWGGGWVDVFKLSWLMLEGTELFTTLELVTVSGCIDLLSNSYTTGIGLLFNSCAVMIGLPSNSLTWYVYVVDGRVNTVCCAEHSWGFIINRWWSCMPHGPTHSPTDYYFL